MTDKTKNKDEKDQDAPDRPPPRGKKAVMMEKAGNPASFGFIRRITCRYRRLCSCLHDIWPGDDLYLDMRTAKIMCSHCVPLPPPALAAGGKPLAGPPAKLGPPS